MQLSPFIVKTLNRLYLRELDPRRAGRVYREFDVNRGYGAYHEMCKANFARAQPPVTGGRLQDHGFEYLDVLANERAAQILRQLRTEHAPQYVKKDSKHLQGFHVTDRKLIQGTVAAVLTDIVDQSLVGFFRSEYLVHWLTFTLTPAAAEQQSVSFRWHCDKGPRSHLKLMIYLNSTDEHGGNTEFIKLGDTASVAARGYLFGWTGTRTDDVNDLSRIAQRTVEPKCKSMGAGEGVIFQPASVLHRGISPRNAPRFVITLCLLPSPVHWTIALQRGAMSDLAVDEKWHRNAGQLRKAVESG